MRLVDSALSQEINILNLSDDELESLSKKSLLSLNLTEMRTIQKYFQKLSRNPTDVELQTLAQTWSEHCKHKTLTGVIEYTEPGTKNSGLRKRNYDNLLKQTIFKVTKELNKKWCISVFKDNAGIIDFDKKYAIAFKVETHNHPSAIEPYGGAGTGTGGVIRDILGVGLGAKPILNTDIFCFGPINYPYKKLPGGVLHPKRIFKGVVAGVRDYGNRMGIPTSNGAIVFDEGYVFNPLVYCGTVGVIPKNICKKQVKPGDLVVAVGGRTGKDGIHGATFSSIALDKDTDVSNVQIGNPIMEKKVLDTVLQARDVGLYRAITDCGAGGFSSAVGELAEDCGAKVYLEKVPLKYKGLMVWEIWLSEAQERMVLAVPKKNIKKLLKIFNDEDVSATVLGEFTDTGKLEVFYECKKVCDLDMNFLHNGFPRVHKSAIWKPKQFPNPPLPLIPLPLILHRLLASPNISSKEWVIRQYDHEVQGTSVIKPLVGSSGDGPSDACVIKPYLESGNRAIAISCGINPNYGKIDPYWMAASIIDEALRNIVCVGGDITRTALLDNFCWGNPGKPDQLAGLVRSAQACYDISKIYGTPFISGKDSLNNEYIDNQGNSVSIPQTLLISAVSIVKDIRKVVTMDLKGSGNSIYILGLTKDELGGSQLYAQMDTPGSSVPKVEPSAAKKIMLSINRAFEKNLVLSCHDCSEGGLAVSCAEMCFAGSYGMEIYLKKVPFRCIYHKNSKKDVVVLFSESNSRFVVEIKPENEKQFEHIMRRNIFAKIGIVLERKRFVVHGLNGKVIIDEDIERLKNSWKKTLKNP